MERMKVYRKLRPVSGNEEILELRWAVSSSSVGARQQIVVDVVVAPKDECKHRPLQEVGGGRWAYKGIHLCDCLLKQL